MTNENDPAIPTQEHGFDNVGLPCVHTIPGLTKLEYFAAMAMRGLLASWGNHDIDSYEDIASDAVKAAKALITELNKEV